MKKVEEIKSYFIITDAEKKYVRFLQIGLIIFVVSIIIIVGVKGFASEDEISGFSYFKVLPVWASYLVTAVLMIYLAGFFMILSSLISLAFLTSKMPVNMRIALIIAFAIVLFSGISLISYLTGVYAVSIS